MPSIISPSLANHFLFSELFLLFVDTISPLFKKKSEILIGENSFGKGSVQSIIPLKNRGAIRLTISKYYLPSGQSITEVGVTPDIEVAEESDEFRINTENDNQLNFALKLFNG